jgi:hypothetical protein
MVTRYLIIYLGNFGRLSIPYDADGKGCGLDYPDYPFIYFASPHVDVIQKVKLVIMGNNMCFKLSNWSK